MNDLRTRIEAMRNPYDEGSPATSEAMLAVGFEKGRAAVLAILSDTREPDSLDVERLQLAFVEVEAGYTYQPDRTTRTYWRKVAAAYAKPGYHASRNDAFSEKSR